MRIKTDGKAEFVNQMFARIARRYDLMNRLMTGGRDVTWRRFVVEQAALSPGGMALDAATGTADIALELARQNGDGMGDGMVVGLDFCQEMMEVGQDKVAAAGARVRFVAGDMLHLPFPDNTFQAVTTGFAMRNVTDIPGTFAEMRRVVRPGGRVVCLEIARPGSLLFRPLFRLYFYRLVPLMGALISGQDEAYSYLPHSLTDFPAPDELAATMEEVGLRQVRYTRLNLGTVAVHVGVK